MNFILYLLSYTIIRVGLFLVAVIFLLQELFVRIANDDKDIRATMGRVCGFVISMLLFAFAFYPIGQPEQEYSPPIPENGSEFELPREPDVIPPQSIHRQDIQNTIRAGGQRSFVIAGDNNLYAWGDNWSGTLGDGTGIHRPLNVYPPARILDNVVFVSDGRAITEDGTLWAWGNNSRGQIGDGTTYTRYYPVPIRMANSVIAVSDGIWSTFAITSDNILWSWGANGRGQLRNGTLQGQHIPFRVKENVIAISAKTEHTMAVTSDGQLWGWGRNDYGQLGDGTTIDRFSPVPIMGNVIAVSAGGSRTMAINHYGILWAWGINVGGGVGDGSSINRLEPVRVALEYNVIAVSAGGLNAIAITEDGTHWVWGRFQNLHLGSYIPVRLSEYAHLP